MRDKIRPRTLLTFAVLYSVLSGFGFLIFAFRSHHTGIYGYARLVIAIGFGAVAFTYYWQWFRKR